MDDWFQNLLEVSGAPSTVPQQLEVAFCVAPCGKSTSSTEASRWPLQFLTPQGVHAG